MLELYVYAYSSFDRSGTILLTVLRVVYAHGGGGGGGYSLIWAI